ncbi:uncharacterized protein At1g66480-like [Andrographis paniculata]|uniref:uncharacterized protein At1g66480-like n=1 Tax=Andrographis paniculata TaxID=175694 RepID=UPI0021E954A3|nr:uncharacterized protein At1g66480-like [Andrographis paniculata]
MGNGIGGGGSSSSKIMKIDGGETFKLKPPATAMEVLKDYSDRHVLLEYQAVKKFGLRAPKLPPWAQLKPGGHYFLVEMPRFPHPPRERQDPDTGTGSGSVMVKVRVPRARIEEVMKEDRDEAEVAEKIVGLCFETFGRDL